jgi:hypothetical protein
MDTVIDRAALPKRVSTRISPLHLRDFRLRSQWPPPLTARAKDFSGLELMH